MVGIYKILSPSGKVYIGQSWDIGKRVKDYSNKKSKSQPALNNSFIKHGFENHTTSIAHELPKDVSQQVLDVYEQLYMDTYRDAGILLLNVREAGSRGKHSVESIDKMKVVQKLIPRKKASKETKLKMSVSAMGHPGAMKGKNHSEYSKNKMKDKIKEFNHWSGRKHTDESIEKMKMVKAGTTIKPENRFNHVGAKNTEASKQKVSESLKQYWANKKLNK